MVDWCPLVGTRHWQQATTTSKFINIWKEQLASKLHSAMWHFRLRFLWIFMITLRTSDLSMRLLVSYNRCPQILPLPTGSSCGTAAAQQQTTRPCSWQLQRKSQHTAAFSGSRLHVCGCPAEEIQHFKGLLPPPSALIVWTASLREQMHIHQSTHRNDEQFFAVSHHNTELWTEISHLTDTPGQLSWTVGYLLLNVCNIIPTCAIQFNLCNATCAKLFHPCNAMNLMHWQWN